MNRVSPQIISEPIPGQLESESTIHGDGVRYDEQSQQHPFRLYPHDEDLGEREPMLREWSYLSAVVLLWFKGLE